MKKRKYRPLASSPKNYTPPRSMTAAEQEYYNKHKSLHGFNRGNEQKPVKNGITEFPDRKERKQTKKSKEKSIF